jgi:hypothetical protein
MGGIAGPDVGNGEDCVAMVHDDRNDHLCDAGVDDAGGVAGKESVD